MSDGSKEGTNNSPVDLDGCYGQIGISAVAAAIRYQSDCKNPFYAPRDREPEIDTEGSSST
jgi:hypothetical protein